MTGTQNLSSADKGGPWDRNGLNWALFEFARNPFYLLVIVYVFAPYLARDVVAGNALNDGLFAHLPLEEQRNAAMAHGQAFVAGVTKWAGAAAALSAPVLGAALDRGGKRKPMMVCFLAIITLMAFALWWVQPGSEGLPMFWVAITLILASICYTYSEVVHNAMLSEAGRPSALSQISGNGLALGSLAGTLLMLGVVVCFAMPNEMGIPFDKPLFGVDVSEYEHYRLAGPIAGLWLAVFIWPFILFFPDSGHKSVKFIPAIKQGFAGLVQTLRKAREHKEVMKFLGARMIYADGMTALLALGAVYVAGALDWQLTEMVGYAIWISIFATMGGFFGGFLDKNLGCKHALIVELSSLCVVLAALLLVTQDSIFLGLIPVERVHCGEIFSHTYDYVYLGVTAFLGLFATACISSSRSMLVGIAPQHMIGEFFGLYAIAGTVTVWLGPLLVEVFTRTFNSQRIGMSVIGVLFVVGLGLLTTVRYQKPTTA